MKIYSYEELCLKLDDITSNEGFVKGEDVYTSSSIKIPYYLYGTGPNHIIVMGLTHGSEIITVNVLLDIMEHYYLIDKNSFTIHFIPVFNLDGYIISTSCLRNISNIEEFSYNYYLNYKYDCINNESVKRHQNMFSFVNYDCINNLVIRNKVKKIYDKYPFPNGSMVIWRSNGDGIDLNREHPLMELSYENDTFLSDNYRYNNILFNTPGPLGYGSNEVKSKENTFLFELLCKLYNTGKYAGLISYHSTGGCIYYEPHKSSSKYEEFLKINKRLAYIYSLNTRYKCSNGLIKDGYKLVKNSSLNSTDEYLRTKYPGVILVELSYMGGNPLGPFGDKVNNYMPTIEYNRRAFMEFIKECKKIKESYRKK